MKIAIVDDQPQELSSIQKLVQQYTEGFKHNSSISCYSSGAALLQAQPEQYSVILLDICMEDMDGIETARHLRTQSWNGKLILLTSSPDYAMESYDVKASYYLLKSHAQERLIPLLQRYEQEFDSAPPSLELIADRLPTRILLQDILYAETARNSTVIFTRTGSLKAYLSITMLRDRLAEYSNFLLCHQSFLVNLDYVTGIQDDCFRMTNGALIAIRRRGLSQIRRVYENYLFEKMAHTP